MLIITLSVSREAVTAGKMSRIMPTVPVWLVIPTVPVRLAIPIMLSRYHIADNVRYAGASVVTMTVPAVPMWLVIPIVLLGHHIADNVRYAGASITMTVPTIPLRLVVASTSLLRIIGRILSLVIPRRLNDWAANYLHIAILTDK